jgi:hypothetical protein
VGGHHQPVGESRRSVCVSGDTRQASPASAGFAEQEPLPAAWGRGSRSGLRASVARSVASRHRRHCLGAGLERWSRKVKRSVLPAGKGALAEPCWRPLHLVRVRSTGGHHACWWQVRRFGGRGRGQRAPAPSGRRSGTPTEASAQRCDCDRSEHNEQRREAHHDTPPFGLGRVSDDATIRQVRAAQSPWVPNFAYAYSERAGARRGCFLGALTLV